MWEPMPNDDVFGGTSNSVPIQVPDPPPSRVDIGVDFAMKYCGDLLRRLAD